MDIQMPIMDGYTAINILKSDNELKNIPIIALTASGMKQEKDKLDSIANDYLLKPIFKYELLALLVKYLPYESVIEKTDIDDSALKPIINQEELSIEVSVELVQKFLPTIKKLQKTLNFDDLIDFGKELEKFTLKHSITQINKYCSQLNDHIATFNVDKIYTTLDQLTIYIDK